MLTDREKEVFRLKKEGKTQIEIASLLKISQPAVSLFYNNSLRKIKSAEETLAFVRGEVK